MTFSRTAMAGALLTLCMLGGAPLSAQSPTDLAGSWTLNRQLSQFPKDVGFSASVFPTEPGGTSGTGPGERRGGVIQTETQEDAKRSRFLTDEVRVPPDHLTIAVTPALVTITPNPGAERTVQPGRRDQDVKIGPVTAITNTSWEAGHLTVVYKAETGRLLRYTYTPSQNPRQLVVDVEFVEGRGVGDRVRRIYQPTQPGETLAAPSSSTLGAPAQAPPAAAASTALDQRPDAPLKGLTRLGVVIEDLGTNAATCGLKQDAFETAVTKHLSDAGFRVARNSDEETYLYVNINTVTASAALCVSRYDVTLYSHAEAKLTHTSSPVLLQAELLHRGGLTGGSATTHADGVLKSVLEYVDQFSTRVRDANK